MSKKIFTESDLKILRENKYTYKVTPNTISFTKEFKTIFYEEYLFSGSAEHMTPEESLRHLQHEVGAALMNDSSCVFEMINKTVQNADSTLSVKELCEIAGVSRSGYYAWIKAAPARERQEAQDRADFDVILEAYRMHGYTKGARGIYMAMLHMEPPVIMNLKKIRRLMDKYNLSCPVRKANPYRRMAKALKTSNVADNLLKREFECYGPRMVLLTDITYLPYNGTFAYLSTILDAFTKQVLSYVLSTSLEVDFVLETVKQLVEKHGVFLHAETIIHSDQGCHYTSCSFIEILKSKKLRQSMSRKGNCWDNAPQESFSIWRHVSRLMT